MQMTWSCWHLENYSRITESNFKFKYGNSVLDIVYDYKYLGVILDEHLTLNKCSKSLSGSGVESSGRSGQNSN